MSLDLYKTLGNGKGGVKRGDTIIEVMFAIAVFCLVAVISIAMMNRGVSSAEAALETVVARNELNAQAEALRFIHSSYISEMTLPPCNDGYLGSSREDERCQQYAGLWEAIIANAIAADELSIEYPLNRCEDVYDHNKALLVDDRAFVINTRNISSRNWNGTTNVGVSYVSAVDHPDVFQKAPYNARIIYTYDAATSDADNSVAQFTDGRANGGIIYDRVQAAEGIWVVAVKSSAQDALGNPQFYDFYIQTCWYSPNTTAPVSLDTVIRLYNPKGV